MKIRCSKSDLLKGVNTVYRAVPSKTTMSILQCILINADEGNIKMIANDMELGIETVIKGEIEDKGIVALDAKMLFDIVHKLPDNDIYIESDESFMTRIIYDEGDNNSFKIVGRSGDDFSYLPEIEKKDPLIISEFTLKDIINKTIFSIAENENNKIMTGELFEIKSNRLRVVSLDGHRVSIVNTDLKNEYDERKVIIPGKALSEVSKIIPGDSDKDVSIYFYDKNVLFEIEGTKIVTRLIEGEYFKIDQMLSNDYNTSFSINKKNLLDCIDRATLFIKEGDKKPIIMDIKDDTIQLKINSAVGSMNEDISIEKEGNDLMIGFNPKFLIDALRVIEDEKINIYMVNSKAPCFIKNDNESYIYMVLPINFNVVN